MLGALAAGCASGCTSGPEQYRIAHARPYADVRAEALAATPPVPTSVPARAADLVELMQLEPELQLDLRYATTNNFLGIAVYERGRALLQRPAAEALVRVHRALRSRGLGLRIFDAYRPWYVTKIFWEMTPESQHAFVADPAKGSRHNRGCAVDLTLYDRATEKELAMPTGFDEFTERARPDWAGGTAEQRANRDLLRAAMEKEGFTVYEDEWWHFDWKDWAAYPLGNERL